ncbi:MAG: PBP1A family penicillin-binding protein [Deltaproteobacteria bacterium]|nr:PBP1A family penicillin-binding protein [Deltaproteobacteria bacterium]
MSKKTPKTEEPQSSEARPSRLRRLAGLALKLALLGALLGIGGLGLGFWYLSNDLPSFDSLEDYDPPQTSRVYDVEGKLVGTYFRERRTVVPFAAIPRVLQQAMIAAEDENFFEHEGLDYLGILRAALKNVAAGRVRQGASTITQQVVKTFLLTPERKLKRKMKEMILARRLEQNLSKDEILYLYLNQIYFGHGRYGVEEASRYYFGKSVEDLELDEAAILAGLPKAPAYYSPRRYPEAARKRRSYVLGRMAAAGFISEGEAKIADAIPIHVAPLPPPQAGASYLEEVRRQLIEVLGEEALLEGGLEIHLAMNARMQQAAEDGVRDALHAVDRRQGFRGPLVRVSAETRATLEESFAEELQRRRERGQRMEPWIWNLEELARWDAGGETPPPFELTLPEPGELVAGLVIELPDEKTARISLGSGSGTVRLEDLRWARPFDLEKDTEAPTRISQVLAPLDVVWVRLDAEAPATPGEDSTEIALHLSQLPEVQGALVAIDPRTRGVVAMVGGYDATRDAFNRATQARRQPGSSFKPFVYGAAIDTGLFTAASRVLDAPEVFHDPWTGKVWKPQNYSLRFDGEMSLRQALARSKNIVAVRLIDKVGVDTVVDFARRAGIESKLPRVLPLALGAGEVTPLEHVNAFTTLAAMGVHDQPRMVLEVKNRNKEVIHRSEARPETTLRPAVTFVLADLMTSVMKEGTGKRLNRLGRTVAAKTGTANDQRDAWFVGFTPQMVCGTWVGFDVPKILGQNEYGSKAAGPAWLDFMKVALEGEPIDWFDPPEGIRYLRVDPESGLLAHPDGLGVFEPFVAGTEPLETAPPPDTLLSEDFLTLDPRGIP